MAQAFGKAVPEWALLPAHHHPEGEGEGADLGWMLFGAKFIAVVFQALDDTLLKPVGSRRLNAD